MPAENEYFYFGSVRRLAVGFADIFNGIECTMNGKVERVPIFFTPQAYWRFYAQDVEQRKRGGAENVNFRNILPRMSWEIVSLQYDPSREKGFKSCASPTFDGNLDKYFSQMSPTPYNIGFQLNIATKKMDTGLQIVEQIIPLFRPQYTIAFKPMEGSNLIHDVPITLDGISPNFAFEGALADYRQQEWNLSFTAKSFIYPPLTDVSVIKKIMATFFNDKEQTDPIVTLTTEVSPLEAQEDESFNIIEGEINYE